MSHICYVQEAYCSKAKFKKRHPNLKNYREKFKNRFGRIGHVGPWPIRV